MRLACMLDLLLSFLFLEGDFLSIISFLLRSIIINEDASWAFPVNSPLKKREEEAQGFGPRLETSRSQYSSTILPSKWCFLLIILYHPGEAYWGQHVHNKCIAGLLQKKPREKILHYTKGKKKREEEVLLGQILIAHSFSRVYSSLFIYSI